MIAISSFISNRKWFTLIELIVGMAIFSIGMTAILALLYSTIDNSLYSRHEIVAADILREQVELVKNIRNSNVRNFVPFDRVRLEWAVSSSFSSGTFIIENDFTSSKVTYDQNGGITSSPVYMKDISAIFPTDIEARFNSAKLYLDSQGRFTHINTGTGTLYASYINIRPLEFENAWTITEIKKDGKNQWYILDAHVIVNSRGYREYDLKTIITDWKK